MYVCIYLVYLKYQLYKQTKETKCRFRGDDHDVICIINYLRRSKLRSQLHDSIVHGGMQLLKSRWWIVWVTRQAV